MNKTKICIVSWNGISDVGGVERITYYMQQAWQEEYDVEIIDFFQIRSKTCYGFLLGKHYAMDAFLASIYVKSLKRKNKGDVKIVTQGFNAPFVCADLYVSHGTMRGYKLAVQQDAKWHFNQRFERKSAKRAERVIAVGSHVKDELCELYGIEDAKVRVIENCIDTDQFFPIRGEERKDRRFTILFCGRLEAGKGLGRVLELAVYCETHDNARLLIATNSEENIESFRGFKNTSIRSKLSKNEMNVFYNSGDIMFFPSLYEGFELVTLEALSAGIPVAGNDVGAIADLYKRGQKGVIILRSRNITDDISDMQTLAEQFRDYQHRESLHMDMEQNYNFNLYLEKLRDLWGHT